jgi:hypothetical protein
MQDPTTAQLAAWEVNVRLVARTLERSTVGTLIFNEEIAALETLADELQAARGQIDHETRWAPRRATDAATVVDL